MKYVLMQAPKKEEDYSAQIEIVDNSNTIGKKKVEHLAEMGYIFAGTIESEFRVQQLKSGFAYNARKQVDVMHELFQEISKIADSHIDRAGL